MNDARLFTDYRSSNLMMYQWARIVPTYNPEQFRRWMLSRESSQLRLEMRGAAKRQATCRPF